MHAAQVIGTDSLDREGGLRSRERRCSPAAPWAATVVTEPWQPAPRSPGVAGWHQWARSSLLTSPNFRAAA
jgi:hypothetical protein